MSGAVIPLVRCDGDPECGAETHHLKARTVTDVRALRRPDGWHPRPHGRDICPECWTKGQR